MRFTRPVALLTAIACAVPALGAADSEALVRVKDLDVEPRANLTADDGTLRLHPKALLGVGYNSNIFAEADDENDDIYLRGLAGLQADWRLNPHNALALNGEIEALKYLDSDNDEGDLVGGLLTGDWFWQEANNQAQVHAGYARFDDPLIQTGEQILRQNIDGYLNLDLRGATFRTIIKAGATALDYLEDGVSFDEESRDNTVYRATARLGVNTARDTYYYALVGVDRWDYWENIQYNDSNGLTVGLGTQVRIGDRSTLTAEGGATYRLYEDDFAGIDDYDDEQVLAPYLSIAARWPWETGSRVGLNVFSRLDESLTANAAWIYGAALDGRYRLLARSALFGSLGGYHSEDSGEGPGIPNEERDTVEAVAGVEHEVTKGLVGRLRLTWTDSDAEISNDFTRYIVAFDLAAAF
jgi:hypothetical protein